MSGGCYNYAHHQIDELSRDIIGSTPLRRAFKALLAKIGKAVYAIEWVDSGDYAPGDEDEEIKACLAPTAVLEQVVLEANEAMVNLKSELDRVQGGERDA